MAGSAAYSATSIVVVMAKDKGRGKGTKGGASSSSAAANKVSDRRPPRITSNVKHNLRVLKFWKDYERKQTSGPQPATRFRKKKVMKEVLPDDTDFFEDPSSTLTYTNEGLEIASPVILVDGYNVCGYWKKLKSDFLNGNQGIARQMLIDELVTFSAVREVKVVVVFDAALSGHSTHTETYKGVDVVYSADLSADCWIEKEVEALVADGCPKVWVVTSDVLEQQLAHGEGALIWSSKRLVKEIKESEQELDEELKETRSTSLQGKIFQHKLKPKVVQGLKDLRNRLEEQERRKK
ncbi:uncharacterized protein LOC100834883 isoform X1 [Brachypodium distachyon]|uniref:NYN domain-containing protein n=1 Tax=Brachypodium distachyon TaxID=15368 RepID=I1GL02_BRADI|nr:uncharacterized protein LOC100834883 isoform X1 [Brachypodium distachyon]KQK12190.1 hypothetical protein BRADI_1g02080v3 [Brachypodium distachyon]|eukprot:XP_003562550.1 uncharacterized protein LOC100834883 isoform X1 [Brachypodium distachyon]